MENQNFSFYGIHSFIPVTKQKTGVWFDLPIPVYRKEEKYIVVLAPDLLKFFAKETVRVNEKKIKYNSVLNQFIKLLGFSGKIKDYEETHFPDLQDFMRKHNLLHLNFMNKIEMNNLLFFGIKLRDIADRIFNSDTKIEKVFKGINIDWKKYDDFGLSSAHAFKDAPYNKLLRAPDVFEYCRQNPEERKRLLMATANYVYPQSGYNMIGDLLVYPSTENVITTTTYYHKGADREEENEELQQKWFKLFREEFHPEKKAGWVNVIRYNKNICFLSDGNGGYNVLFRNMRESGIPDRPLERYLLPSRIPRFFMNGYNYPYHLYFKDDFWREKESHEAEQFYYENGGIGAYHPGENEILKAFHKKDGYYKSDLKKEYQVISGFKKIEDLGLCVQEHPVTVSELNEFLSTPEGKKYLNERKTFEDDEIHLEHTNPEQEGTRPAFLTYLDALAYAQWYEKKHKINVRFLKIDEYKKICPASSTEFPRGNRLKNGCLDVFDSKGQKIVEWRGFDSYEWQRLFFNFNEKLEILMNDQGIEFYIGENFGEWLYEFKHESAAAISAATLKGVYSRFDAEGDFFPITSWGKYKKCAIGFRLCYEYDISHTKKKIHSKTIHSGVQMGKRGINSEVVNMIDNKGRCFRAPGGAIKKLIPQNTLKTLILPAHLKEKLKGVAIILGPNGELITVEHITQSIRG